MAMITKRGRRRVYRLVCYLAHSDEHLDLRERGVLESLRKRLKLTEEAAEELEEEAKSGKGLRLKDHGDEAEAALVALSEVFIADGVLHPEEAKRLSAIASSVGFSAKQTAKVLQGVMIKQNQRRTAEESGDSTESDQGSPSDDEA